MTNDGFVYRERLGADAEGRTALDYLSHRHAHSPAREWERRLAAGLVLVDGSSVQPGAVLRRGQSLVWMRPPWDEPDAPLAFAVLYDDGDLLAVAKPAGLPTLPGAGYLHATLLHQVRRFAPAAAPLHRLGRWTSGIVLFARDPASRAALARRWGEGEIVKRYRALASGDPREREFTVSAPIGLVPHARLGTVHAAASGGKPAGSRVVVIERHDGVFLCDVFIATGRPHQIRIHLAAAGFPLAGDPLYGPGGVPIPGTLAVPGDPGYALHAAEIGFRRPRDGRNVTIVCASPPRLRPRTISA